MTIRAESAAPVLRLVSASDPRVPQAAARPFGPARERAVRDQLERILASPDFARSERLRSFLSFLVEEALAGRADRLGGYRLGVEVFGRGDDFDPRNDSLVRNHAVRLRRALERYYTTGGAADPLRIEVPKGGYRPVFSPAAVAPEREGPAAGGDPILALAGDSERGLEVLAKGIALNPRHPGWFHMAPCVHHLRRGELEAALQAAEAINLPDFPWDLAVRAAILADLGRLGEAREAVGELLALDPEFPRHARRYLSGYILWDEVVERLIAGLGRAGLEAP